MDLVGGCPPSDPDLEVESSTYLTSKQKGRNNMDQCMWCGREYAPDVGHGGYCCAKCNAEAAAQAEKELSKQRVDKEVKGGCRSMGYGCVLFILIGVIASLLAWFLVEVRR